MRMPANVVGRRGYLVNAIPLAMRHDYSIHLRISSLRRSTKALVLVVLLWTAISALGALQTYSDNLRIGVVSRYGTGQRTTRRRAKNLNVT